MAITTVDGVVSALGGSFTQFIIDKASLANQVAGRMCSLWRAASGVPAQAAIPTTAVQLSNGAVGSIPFTTKTLPEKAYLGFSDYSNSVAGNALVFCDRIAEQGGLNFNITTSQTTNLPINLGTLGVVSERIGAADYREIQWYLEVYSDGGATASNATVSVIYDDNTSGNLNIIAVGGTLRAGQCIALNPFKAINGRFIKGVTSVILSAATGTVGNFGITAVREIASCSNDIASKRENFDWAKLGLPTIPSGACVFPMVYPITTSSGIVKAIGKIIYG
jgi:hypothetical protein